MGRRTPRTAHRIHLRLSLALVLCMLLCAPFAWADGETGTFRGLGPSGSISGTLDGQNKSTPGGTMRFELSGGEMTSSFCTDMRHTVSGGDTFVTSDEAMACSVRWLLLHYPPRPSGYSPWPDRDDALDIGDEMAARQAAVWHFSDGFLPDDSTAVGARAWEIIDSVPEEACEADQPAISITPASIAEPINSTQTFTVTVTRGGQPVAGQAVNLSVDHGTLDPQTVTTNDQGQATFTLTHDTPDTTSHIEATAEMLLPVGTIFVGTETNRQKLVLGEEVLGTVQGEAIATWTGTGSVTTLSFDDYDMDGEHDSGEPLLEGWTVTLFENQGGSWNEVGTDTTNESGTAQFTALSAGTYRIEETMPSGWHNTTPLTTEFSLSLDESRSFVFGQIKLPVIIGHVFQDEDLDGAYDAGEPALEGWDLQLYRENGSPVIGMQAVTDDAGQVIFSSHPERDPPEIIAGTYYVQETLQSGWYATTGISQTVEVESGDMGEAWLGNIHPEPALALEKSAPEYAHEGDSILYEFTVTNTGNVPLEGVTVDDPLLGGTVCDLGTLNPNQSLSCDSTYAPEQPSDPVGNSATASGTEPYLGNTASASAQTSTDVLHPDIDVSITPSPDEVYAGELVELDFAVTNTSDTALYDVSILFDNGTADPSDDYVVCTFDEMAEGATVNCGESVHPLETTTFGATASGSDLLDGTANDSDEAAVTILGEIPDEDEPKDDRDSDGDGIPDYIDEDDDGDGIADEDEGISDADGDGLPNFLDRDSDGDGIPDEIETAADADGDGLPNFLDSDSDGDGIPDETETASDADGDGLPNFLDLDSDGDGILDEIETGKDRDGDGIPNFLDLDSDGDGILDEIETAEDEDGDEIPNFLDLDSDSDGILDSQEWSVGADDPLAGCDPSDPVAYDNDADGDGIPNFLDSDSDGDGIPDEEEIGPDPSHPIDSDEDGVPDWLDPNPNPSPEDADYDIYLPLVGNGL